MTITLTKSKLAVVVAAATLAVPTAALASHVFDDVPDDAFYAAPVEWAFDNGITTGKSPTSFAPLDDVTRGESVTFLKRYDDNIVQPALADLENSGIDSVQVTGTTDPVTLDATDPVLIDSVTIGGTGTVDVALNAHVQIENDGTVVAQGRFEVTLRQGDCSGAVLGAAGLRTGVTTSTFVNSTVPVTGLAAEVEGGSTFALCAEKSAPGGADGTAFRRGIVAIWS